MNGLGQPLPNVKRWTFYGYAEFYAPEEIGFVSGTGPIRSHNGRCYGRV
jgi:hypothetical protein